MYKLHIAFPNSEREAIQSAAADWTADRVDMIYGRFNGGSNPAATVCVQTDSGNIHFITRDVWLQATITLVPVDEQ